MFPLLNWYKKIPTGITLCEYFHKKVNIPKNNILEIKNSNTLRVLKHLKDFKSVKTFEREYIIKDCLSFPKIEFLLSESVNILLSFYVN